MCDYRECISGPWFRTITTGGCIEVAETYIDGYPFAVIVIDTRSGEHLHFPAPDWEVLMGKRSGGVRQVRNRGKSVKARRQARRERNEAQLRTALRPWRVFRAK